MLQATLGQQPLASRKFTAQSVLIITYLQRQDEDEVAQGVREHKQDLPQLEAFCMDRLLVCILMI